MRAVIVVISLLLAGCISQATLIAQDGKRYRMDISEVSKKVSANIDGTLYSGLYSGGSSTAVGMAGAKPLAVSGSGGNQGQAMMAAPEGDFIQSTSSTQT